jgi:apolipoprotein D and lipocalin family protein
MRAFFITLMTFFISSCHSTYQPLPPLEKVDLEKFMGRWYVIANIPTFIEKGAHNAIEHYQLDSDGTIATTFTFRADTFDGKEKRYTPRGFIVDRNSNALWGMQFIWPIKADYRITYLDANYTQTIISRIQRDYVWIMARTPHIPEDDYQRLVKLIREQGYDISKIKKVPQQW